MRHYLHLLVEGYDTMWWSESELNVYLIVFYKLTSWEEAYEIYIHMCCLVLWTEFQNKSLCPVLTETTMAKNNMLDVCFLSIIINALIRGSFREESVIFLTKHKKRLVSVCDCVAGLRRSYQMAGSKSFWVSILWDKNKCPPRTQCGYSEGDRPGAMRKPSWAGGRWYHGLGNSLPGWAASPHFKFLPAGGSESLRKDF